MKNVPMISGLSALAPDMDAILCDVWGVLHNGVIGYADAGAALEAFRESGKPVVLLTNAPRPAEFVAGLLDRFGIPRDAYDAIVTSGDVCRELLARQGRVAAYHLGPERDRNLFDGLDMHLVDADDAKIIVCTGLFDDETETPEDYRAALTGFAARGLHLFCPNPDMVVERGHRLIYCAGALATLYRDLGGEATMVGKPYPAVYQAALAKIDALAGRSIDKHRVLAIGDAFPTDIRGAFTQDLSILMVTSGIHAADFGDADAPDPARLGRRLEEEGLTVTGALPRLKW